MNTKLIMTLTSIVMGSTGIFALFAPMEMITIIGIKPSHPLLIIVQIMGSIYMAFTTLNWLAKDSMIGGIYGKPIAIGNFTHFLIVSIILSKALVTNLNSLQLWILTLIYMSFAISFTYVAFKRSP